MDSRYLYRAKRTDNGEWVEGFYCKWVKGKRVIAYSEKEVDCIITWMSNGGMSRFEVDQSTICQCTGLKDKNGNLIWENDIVSFTHSKITSVSLAKDIGFPDFEKEEYKRNYAIEFVNTYCTYGLRFRNKSIHFPCKSSTLYMHDCIVIGNIFDNPELLEVGEC